MKPVLHTLLLVGSLSLTLLARPGTAQVGNNMKDQMIFHYCSKALDGELSKAGKTAPSGMVSYTCGCVVQQMDARASLDQAKAICQANAMQKYSLP